MLGNIDPKFRSTLKSIQLLTIANTVYIEKYGIDAILEPFMKDILKLEEVHLHVHASGLFLRPYVHILMFSLLYKQCHYMYYDIVSHRVLNL